MTQDEQARLWVQRLRAGYEAFNREEFDESLEFMHPDIEWHRGAVSIEGGVIRGRDQVRALMTPDIFVRQQIKVGEIQTNGEKVLVETTFPRARALEWDRARPAAGRCGRCATTSRCGSSSSTRRPRRSRRPDLRATRRRGPEQQGCPKRY